MGLLQHDSHRIPSPGTPGWYPAPDNPDELRHWHGSGWSESLFDDITSVAVVESRDTQLFLDPALFVDESVPSAPATSPADPPARGRPTRAGLVAASLIAVAAAGVSARRSRLRYER